MSILGLGSSYKDTATAGFRDVAELENARKMQNDANDYNYKLAKYQSDMGKNSSTASSTLMGAGMGAAGMGAKIGLVGGVPGALVGAAVGFLLSKLF